MNGEEIDSLHLHVSIGNVTIEVDGPVDDAETWFEALREDYLSDVDEETIQEQTTARNPDTSSTEAAGSAGTADTRNKSKSLTEFYRMSEGLSKKDTAFLTGWYLEYHEGQDDFTRPEIEETAQSAKLQLGKNVGRDLRRQVKDGHLEEVGEREGHAAYHVTLTGEEFVDDELFSS